jgi:hypothetical protein
VVSAKPFPCGFRQALYFWNIPKHRHSWPKFSTNDPFISTLEQIAKKKTAPKDRRSRHITEGSKSYWISFNVLFL